MKEDSQRRRRYELYVRKDNLDNIIKIRDVLKEDEQSLSEHFYQWIVEGFNKYMQERGRLSILEQFDNKIEQESKIRADKNKLYLHMWSEYYKSKMNPKETKHIDNIVTFANDLGDEYLENLPRDEQFRLVPIFRILKAAQIANKVQPNSVTGEK